MARTFLAANSRYGSLTLPASYSAPCTMACRFTPSAIGMTGVIIQLNNGSSIYEVYQHTDNKFHIDTSTTTSAGTITIAAGTTYYLVAVFLHATSRILYVNGAVDRADGQNGTATGNVFAIGSQRVSTPYYASGTIQDAAFWSRGLSPGEITALYDGFTPAAMPYLLRAYCPLYGNESPEPNLCGAAMTLVNTPPKAAHARVLLPS